MFNVTGGEIVIVLLLALIVLGPDKLPEFIRGAGRMYGEIKKMTSGFSTEFRDAVDEPMREMRETANMAKNWFEEGRSESDISDESSPTDGDDDADDGDDADDPNFYDDDGVLLDAEAISRMTSDAVPETDIEATPEIDKPGTAPE